MDKTLYIKSKITYNPIVSEIAENLLNIFTEIRFLFTKSYCSGKEDFIVKKILDENFNMKMNEVKYLDIGANTYKRGNNSYLFYRRGMASGIVVEADPIFFEKLKKKRKRDKIYNVAIGIENCEALDFYVLNLPTRSSLDVKQIEKSVKEGLKVVKIIKVPCVTIDFLLEENNLIPDYISIDIEGMDFKVLQTINLKKYPVKVIVAEKSDEKNDNGNNMDEFMLSMGYQMKFKTNANSIYVNKSLQIN